MHVFLELTLFKEKAGKNCLFLFRAGRDCNYCFQVFSEKLPCPYYLTLKIYHLEMVCFLRFCILDVWCKNVYTCTHTHACKYLLTHKLPHQKYNLSNAYSMPHPPEFIKKFLRSILNYSYIKGRFLGSHL